MGSQDGSTRYVNAIYLPSFPFAREEGYNPPTLNAKLRYNAPISKVRLYDGNEAWIVTKHKHCCEALDSKKLSADRRSDGYPEIHSGGHKAKEATPLFVNLDDPDHAKQRDMLEAEFTPETVNQKWRPMMEKTIDSILDNFIDKGKSQQPIDLIEEFAAPVPTQIIYKALGVPDRDIERLSGDSEVRNSTSRNAAESANTNLQDYMSKLVEQKIEQPTDDIISRLVVEQYRHGNLSASQISAMAFLVLTAGNAALINSIGLGTLTLLQHPEQLEAFKKNPSMAPKVANEISRYHTTSALNSRRAVKDDVKLGDQVIRKGESIICSVEAGNRDEDKFSEPEKFNIHRDFAYEDSLGFGHGPHRCQGESFSRLELEIAFTKLFQRLPNLLLAASPSDLQYSPPTMNVGIAKLPVLFQ